MKESRRAPESHPPVITVSSFDQAMQVIRQTDFPYPRVLLTDVDGTLKGHDLFAPGKLDEQKIIELKNLEQKGWTIAAVTDQLQRGHQIATLMGNLRGYPSYPKAFHEQQIKIFAKRGLSPMRPYKRTGSSLFDVAFWIWTGPKIQSLVMLGDKHTDIRFFNNLVATLKSYNVEIPKPLMIKLPPFPNAIPHTPLYVLYDRLP